MDIIPPRTAPKRMELVPLIDDKKLFKFKCLCNDVTFTDTNIIKIKDKIEQNNDIGEITYFISMELPNSLKNI